MTINLTKEELMEAVKQGVKEAILETIDDDNDYQNTSFREEMIIGFRKGVCESLYIRFPDPQSFLGTISNLKLVFEERPPQEYKYNEAKDIQDNDATVR